ncbi:hypothetical protein ACDX78_22185 [Virgibacillus oceani]
MESKRSESTNVSTSQRTLIINIVLTIVVLGVELMATYASLTGEPLNPVDNWSVTRGTDWVAFAAVVIGCCSLYWRHTHPILALVVATSSYCVFMLREYELGLFLPAMLMLYTIIASGHSRKWAVGMAAASIAISLFWLYERLVLLEDAGVTMLAWVAFGTVFGVFFAVPLLIGEIVRLRRKISGV